jgi:hypothetical protein
VTSKKQGVSALAYQPKDAVPGDETVWAPEYFIDVTEVTFVDVEAGNKAVMG